MTTVKLLEHRITRRLLQCRYDDRAQLDTGLWADRLIAVLALTAGLFIVGSYFEELLWALLGAATLATLR